MSLYLGETLIAGGGSGYHPPILSCMWSDHLINDIQWLRADTFSWQSGDVYKTVYDKLVEEYSTGTEETEGSITFRRSSNNFKITTSDMESAILNKYNSDGISWYYILDTTNKRFKLPRTKFGFEGLRTNVADDIAESLPNITGRTAYTYLWKTNGANGVFTWNENGGGVDTSAISSNTSSGVGSFDASRSSSTYQDNAPVQERATQMYLYFYVGEYTQTAIAQTAGITSEELNGKLDLTGGTMTGNLTIPKLHIGNSTNTLGAIELYGGNTSYGGFIDFHYGNSTSDFTSRIIENEQGKISINGSNGVYLKWSYVNGTSGYNIWTNGYCEQWGTSTGDMTTGFTINLLKTTVDTNYLIELSYLLSSRDAATRWPLGVSNKQTSSFTVHSNTYTGVGIMWKVSGYLAEGQY